MTRLEIQEALPAVILGIATLEERVAVEAALKTDPELMREAKELEAVLTGLAAVEAAPVPQGLKAKVMSAAKLESKTLARESRVNTSSAPSSRARGVVPRSMMQRLAPALYIVGAIAIFSVLSLLPNVFKSAHDPVNASVVASTRDGGLVYANSGAVVTPVVLIGKNGERRAVKFPSNQPCYFTRAVSLDGYSYLLDAANSKLFIVDEARGAMIDSWDVPKGAAGLAVQDNTVIVKSAESGIVLEFKRNRDGKTMLEARIAPEPATTAPAMPMEDLMDDLLILGSKVYATHHVMGTVSVLDRDTNKEIRRFKIGTAPVALGQYGENLIVLDHAGALIAANATTGKIVNTLKLEGDADKMTVTHGMAFLSDRSGFITVVNLEQFKVETRKQFGNNARDVSPMPDGHVAVATGEGGVIVLNDQLEKMNTY
jgi:YVTN family beta-propeller protein